MLLTNLDIDSWDRSWRSRWEIDIWVEIEIKFENWSWKWKFIFEVV